MKLKEELQNVSEEFLKECFDELEDFASEGILVQGKIRELNAKHYDNSPTMLHTIGQLVYREIALRHFAHNCFCKKDLLS